MTLGPRLGVTPGSEHSGTKTWPISDSERVALLFPFLTLLKPQSPTSLVVLPTWMLQGLPGEVEPSALGGAEASSHRQGLTLSTYKLPVRSKRKH